MNDIRIADSWTHIVLSIGYRVALVVQDSVPRHNRAARDKTETKIRIVDHKPDRDET